MMATELQLLSGGSPNMNKNCCRVFLFVELFHQNQDKNYYLGNAELALNNSLLDLHLVHRNWSAGIEIGSSSLLDKSLC